MRVRAVAATAALLLAALLLAALSACGGGEDRPGSDGSASGSGTATGASTKTDNAFPESEANTVVKATLRDFAFEGVPATVKGPKVYFEATNNGPSEHELMVQDEAGKDLGEIPGFDKGKESKPLALELKSGRYKVACLLKLGDKTHADLGMEASFTVE